MKQSTTRQITLAAIFTAVGILFPQLFHLFGATAGKIFLPMHIPVLLCGMVCGPMAGALCGMVTPLLSVALTGMPELFPQGVVMMCELCVYGLVGGLLSARRINIYVMLIATMLAGRMVSGLAFALLFGLMGTLYTWSAFFAAAFVTALPGILIQLVVLPPLSLVLAHAGHVGRLPS
ncbi:MAG: ECF transporter S component [Oscillospiraceae bacterium]